MKELIPTDQVYKNIELQEPAIIDMKTGVNSYIRGGWIVLLAGLGSFLLWASLAPLDKGVPLSGTVSVATNLKAVQHEAGGTVDEILVKEGDVVKAGDVLVKMNAVQATANAESNHVQYLIARATEARLIAERNRAASIVFPKELENAKDDERVNSYLETQRQVFASRRGAISSDVSSLEESIQGILAQNRGLEESRNNKKLQLEFIKQQIDGMRDLAREGYVPNNRLLELEQTYAQINATISEDIGTIGRGQRQIAELKIQKVKKLQDYQKEVSSQLLDVQKQADALAKQLTGLNREVENVLVRAPVSGAVVGLSVFTKGAVVSPGFKFMDIVPSNDALIVDGQLPVQLIDKVHPGQKVELMFTAFNQNTTPRVPGEVSHVSADRFVDEKTGVPYYKLIAKVAGEGKKEIEKLDVRPGMSVDLFVITGERTMMSYLFKPIYDRLRVSMTED